MQLEMLTVSFTHSGQPCASVRQHCVVKLQKNSHCQIARFTPFCFQTWERYSSVRNLNQMKRLSPPLQITRKRIVHISGKRRWSSADSSVLRWKETIANSKFSCLFNRLRILCDRPCMFMFFSLLLFFDTKLTFFNRLSGQQFLNLEEACFEIPSIGKTHDFEKCKTNDFKNI